MSTPRHAAFRFVLRRTFLPISRHVRSLAWHRALLDRVSGTIPGPRDVVARDVTLGGRPARQLSLTGSSADRRSEPHVLYLHGGGYVAGGLTSHTGLAAHVARTLDARGWLLDYRLAPEHPYPAAREDALSAYRELLDQGVEPGRIVIAGDSAGGGLTLSTAAGIRHAGWPMPAGLVLLSPWTDLTLSAPSYMRNKRREVMLSTRFLSDSAGSYCGERGGGRRTSRADPGVSPMFADLAGLPPILAQVGGDEILLDDARLVVEQAQAAGVQATLQVYDRLWHVFHAGIGLIPEADAALREIGRFGRQVIASPASL
ncbi:MAG: alpha/beta hydrolase [Polyangiales bacterium]|nr:alpha/beta hydrolase [Sandaracinaceae bacterium]